MPKLAILASHTLPRIASTADDIPTDIATGPDQTPVQPKILVLGTMF